MTRCGACNSRILLGGVTWEAWTCCNEECVRSLKLALTTQFVPTADIERQTTELHQAACLICGKEGPNDVYTTRKVTGMILAVQWAVPRHVCCATCARGKRLAAAAHCLVLGWWSPKAFITNVFYLPYNLLSVAWTKPTTVPSKALSGVVMESIADANGRQFAEAVRSA